MVGAEEALAVAMRVRKTSMPLWPGFRPAAVPLALFSYGGEAWLVGHPSPPPGFVPTTYPGVTWALAGHPDLNAATITELSGVWTAAVPLQYYRPEYPWRFEVTCLHEAFHTFQRMNDWPQAGPTPWAEMSPRAAAYARLEAAALEAALYEPSAGAAAKFLNARMARRALLPHVAVLHEQVVELIEGTAHLIEARALEGLPVAQDWWRQRIGEYLGKAGGPVHDAFRGIWYRSGAVLGTLLDHLNPGWEGQLPGMFLDDLLPITPQPLSLPAGLLDEEERRRADWESHKDALLVQVDGGTVLLAPGLEVQSWDPLNLERLDADRSIHTRLLTIVGPWGELRYNRSVPGCTVPAVLVDMGTQEIRFRGTPGPGFELRFD